MSSNAAIVKWERQPWRPLPLWAAIWRIARRLAAVLAAVLAMAAVGCAATQVPQGCDERAFGAITAGCVAEMAAAEPAEVQAVADACVLRINEREAACKAALQ